MKKTYYLFSMITLLCGYQVSHADDTIPMNNIQAITDNILSSFVEDPEVLPKGSSSTTAKIGTPATSFDVSATGGAVWQMLFDTPEGVGGMTPQIGLAYNSQGGMGLAGQGISITGISVITRGAKNLFYDSIQAAVTYGYTDNLYLDGRRLLLASGSAGHTSAHYHPEGDPYTDVIIRSSNSYGALIIEVNTPDGIKMRYGETTNSRQRIYKDNSYKTNAWYLSSVTDPNGNTMSIEYIIDSYTLYPSKVKYGTNDTAGIESKMTFSYADLPESCKRKYAIGGLTGEIAKKLSSITTATGENVYRHYLLSYDEISDETQRKFSRLTSVTESNGNGDSKNPLTLNWNTFPGSWKQAVDTGINTESINQYMEESDSLHIAADMNGDGVSDIIRFSNVKQKTTIPGVKVQLSYAFIYRSSVGTDGTVSYNPPLWTILETNNNSDDWKEFSGNQVVADFDGDGLDDIIIPAYTEMGGYETFYIEFIFGKDVKAGNGAHSYFASPLNQLGTIPLFCSFDMNGDGKADAVMLENQQSNSQYGLHCIYLSENDSIFHVDSNITLSQQPKRLFTGDYNDDGLTDLLVLYDGGYKVFFHQGGTGTLCPYSDSDTFSGTNVSEKWRVEQGDFNGDGRIDFIYVADQSNKYYFALNNGDGTFTVSLALESDLKDQSTSMDNNQFTLTPIDLDHDGMTDLIITKAVYSGSSYQKTAISWLLSNGSTLNQFRRANTSSKRDAFPWNILVGDFNGDGQAEMMNVGRDFFTYNTTAPNDGSHFRYYRTSGLTAGSGLLASVTDGMGRTTQVAYSTLAAPAVYDHQYNSAYPVTDIHVPLTVVKSATIPFGASSHTNNYSYSGMKMVSGGKGLLGFTSTSIHNLSTGLVEQSGITSFNTLYYAPSVTWRRVVADSVSTYSVTENNFTASGSKNFAVFPLSTTETDFDGHTAVTSYTWDTAKGKPLTEHTVYDNDQGMYREMSYQYYVKKGNRWLPQTVVSSQRHSDDAASFSLTTKYTYDNKGRVTQRIDRYGTPKALTTSYTYDTFGNVTSDSISGGVATITSYTSYDTSGRFPVRKWQSPAAAENTYTYDTWGNVLTATDATESGNPLTTTYTRDGWGDVTAVTDPAGVTTSYTQGWGTTATQKYYTDVNNAGSGMVRTWYDSAGRETRREENGPGGIDIINLISYDQFGEVSVTVRTTGGGQVNRTEVRQTTRDSRRRVSQEWQNTGAYTNYVYGDRSVTATDQSGRVTETEYDAWGNTVSTTDDLGNTVSYTYYSNGKPQSVTTEGADGSSSTVEMEYDAAGNRTSLDDPDAGLITYTWSADGKLLSSVDARGNITQNTYDNLGRLTTSTTGGITTTYSYGTSGYSKLRLDSISRQGRTLSYTYDQYGRTSSVTRNYGDGTLFTHTYSYDSYGRLEETDFPSGLETYYYYDSYGHLNGIATGGGDAWNLLSYNGLTMVTEAGTDNLHITTVNDNWGKLTERYLTLGNDTTKRCRLAFTYDNLRGNLTSRTGVNGASVTESFTYDTLDRLTSAGNETYTYAANGNILNKTYIGTYTYSTDKPHAVAHVQNTSNRINKKTHSITYDAFGKMTAVEYTSSIGRESYETDGQRPTQPVIISQRHDISYGPDGERWKSVTQDVTSGGTDTQTIFYAGDYERVITRDSTVIEYHYLGEGIVAAITDGGNEEIYYAVTDNVGSYVHLVNAATGTAAFSAKYDSWGRMTKTVSTLPFHRGYGGHEMLTEFGLVNMNGRMYDYNIGRFLSPDNYVQMPDDSQSFNRYSYCLNNPLKYTDPSGEAWWVPIVAGALIGGAISGASYAVSVGITGGTWNGREFLKSIGIGAFAGALSAGMGQASAALGISKTAANTLGYKCFSQITNSIATNAVFGNSMDWSDVAGIAVSSFVATKLPDYKATGKSLFSNFIGETVHNTLAGATTGFVQGATKSLIKNDARFVFENTMGGAVSGFSRTVAHNALLGSPYYTNPAYDKSSGIIRRGGLFGLFANMIKNGQYMGITLGRNSYSVDGNLYTTAHESYHLSDIERMGWAAFYSRIISEYIKYGYGKSYGQPGTLEYNAEIYGTNTLKILSPPIVIKPKLLFPF